MKPAEILTLKADALAIPNGIRNHSGHRGVQDWTKPVQGTLVRASTTAAGSYDGSAFFLTTAPANPPFLTDVQTESRRFKVTPGWVVQIRHNAAPISGAPKLTVQISYFNARGEYLSEVPVVVAQTPADGSWNLTVPSGADTASLRYYIEPATTASNLRFSRVTARSAATASELSADAPAEAWTNLSGGSLTITTESGLDLEGVEDVLKNGTLTAVIRDATFDPATSTSIRRGRRIALTAQVTPTKVEPVWEGRIETVDADYPENTTLVTITATDSARDLEQTMVPGILDFAGYPLDGIAETVTEHAAVPTCDGTSKPIAQYLPENLSNSSIQSVEESTSAVTWLKRLRNTYGLSAWVDPADVLQIRTSALPTVGVAQFSDRLTDTTAIHYQTCPLQYGSRSCTTVLTVRRTNVSEVFDSGSKVYGPYIASAAERENGRLEATLEIVGGNPASFAASVLPRFAYPGVVAGEITVNTMRFLEKMLALRVYDPIIVRRRDYVATLRLLSIRHEITATEWVTTLTPRRMETLSTAVVVSPPAAGANTGPRDAISNSKPLAARTRNTTQSLESGVGSAIDFTTSVSDGGIPYANRRFTIPRDGRYTVNATVEWPNGGTAAGTGIRRVYIQRNRGAEATFLTRKSEAGTATSNSTQSIGGSFYFKAGDALSIVALQNSGVTRTTGPDETGVTIAADDA